jgi:hypothetical protein
MSTAATCYCATQSRICNVCIEELQRTTTISSATHDWEHHFDGDDEWFECSSCHAVRGVTA